jgi:hypothetical protein
VRLTSHKIYLIKILDLSTSIGVGSDTAEIIPELTDLSKRAGFVRNVFSNFNIEGDELQYDGNDELSKEIDKIGDDITFTTNEDEINSVNLYDSKSESEDKKTSPQSSSFVSEYDDEKYDEEPDLSTKRKPDLDDLYDQDDEPKLLRRFHFSKSNVDTTTEIVSSKGELSPFLMTIPNFVKNFK